MTATIQDPAALHFAPLLWPEYHAETTEEFIFDRSIWKGYLAQAVDRRWLAGLYKIAAETYRVIVLVNCETLYAVKADRLASDDGPGPDAEHLGVLRHRDGTDGLRKYARDVCLRGLSDASSTGLASVVILGGAYSSP